MRLWYVLLLALAVALPAAEYSCRFTADGWAANDWVLVKSPRWTYFGGWEQQADHILNAVPADATDAQMLGGKWAEQTYTSMLWREKVSGRKIEISSTLSFDYRMAPLIVLAPELGADAAGRPEYREHWEIVLFDEGLNVWHHTYGDGKPAWVKAAYLQAPFRPGEKYALRAVITFTAKGPMLEVSCGGHTFGCTVPTLPPAFQVGITGCEGRNRFYDFSVKY